MDYDLLIAGAGPAGAALAQSAARGGCRVLLVDRAAFPRSKPCAEYLSPKTLSCLDGLGVTSRLGAHEPATIEGMRIVPEGSPGFVGRFTEPEPHGFPTGKGLALPREVLDHEIAAAAVRGGAEFLPETLLETFENEGGRISATLRSGRSRRRIRARLLVGADGLHSRIARRIGARRHGRLRRFGFVTHFENVQGMRKLGEMHVRPEAYVGLAPVGKGITNVSLVVDLDRTPPIHHPLSFFRSMIARFGEVGERLAHARRTSPISPVGPFARRSTTAVHDRILLVGDAADFYDPFTGEGIYAALRGAELAWSVLRDRVGADRLLGTDLRAYDRARRHAFGAKWAVERIIAWLIRTPALFPRVAHRLRTKPELADLIVGITGGPVPPSRMLQPTFLFRLVW